MKRNNSRLKVALNELRQKQWIAFRRKTVMSDLKNCESCVKQNTKLLNGLPKTSFSHYREKIDFILCSTGVNYLESKFFEAIFKTNFNDLFKVFICFVCIFWDKLDFFVQFNLYFAVPKKLIYIRMSSL